MTQEVKGLSFTGSSKYPWVQSILFSAYSGRYEDNPQPVYPWFSIIYVLSVIGLLYVETSSRGNKFSS